MMEKVTNDALLHLMGRYGAFIVISTIALLIFVPMTFSLVKSVTYTMALSKVIECDITNLGIGDTVSYKKEVYKLAEVRAYESLGSIDYDFERVDKE